MAEHSAHSQNTFFLQVALPKTVVDEFESQSRDMHCDPETLLSWALEEYVASQTDIAEPIPDISGSVAEEHYRISLNCTVLCVEGLLRLADRDRTTVDIQAARAGFARMAADRRRFTTRHRSETPQRPYIV